MVVLVTVFVVEIYQCFRYVVLELIYSASIVYLAGLITICPLPNDDSWTSVQHSKHQKINRTNHHNNKNQHHKHSHHHYHYKEKNISIYIQQALVSAPKTLPPQPHLLLLPTQELLLKGNSMNPLSKVIKFENSDIFS